jgi:hypothetical protein
VGVAVDRDPALLHALQQPRLRLGRRAVDLVDEHDVGEHRAGAELKALLALVVDVRADDVGRQQVRRPLNAGELGVDRARQRTGQGGLADPRVVLDQDMALGEQRDDQLRQARGRDLNRPRDIRLQSAGRRGERLRLVRLDRSGLRGHPRLPFG